MKKILFLIVFLMTFSLYGDIGYQIEHAMGESIENYSCSGQNSLNYCHEQVDGLLNEWDSKGYTKGNHYKDTAAWATDLMDNDLCSGCGTDSYTDDAAHLVVFSGHGGVDGNSRYDMWSSTAMCPHNGHSDAEGRYIDFDNHDIYYNSVGGSYLVLFTCFSVHDFSKDNNPPYISDELKHGTTWREWDYPFRKNASQWNGQMDSKDSGLNMVFGFAGLSTDSSTTYENGEDFIADMHSESQKQAWFTGNDDWATDDRTGVITWGTSHWSKYNANSGLDATARRDNHKLADRVDSHSGSVAMAWAHHDN